MTVAINLLPVDIKFVWHWRIKYKYVEMTAEQTSRWSAKTDFLTYKGCVLC